MWLELTTRPVFEGKSRKILVNTDQILMVKPYNHTDYGTISELVPMVRLAGEWVVMETPEQIAALMGEIKHPYQVASSAMAALVRIQSIASDARWDNEDRLAKIQNIADETVATCRRL